MLKSLIKNNLKWIILIVFTILFSIIFRLNNNSPNFTPLISVALFSGIFFKNKYSFLIPISIMLISDFFIGFYQLPIMIAVYSSLILINLLGYKIKNRNSYFKIILNTVFGAILFFLITNFAVWVFGAWYPKTVSGLFTCFINAIPFFRNTLSSGLFFSSVFFIALELFSIFLKQKQFYKSYFKDSVSYILRPGFNKNK